MLCYWPYSLLRKWNETFLRKILREIPRGPYRVFFLRKCETSYILLGMLLFSPTIIKRSIPLPASTPSPRLRACLNKRNSHYIDYLEFGNVVQFLPIFRRKLGLGLDWKSTVGVGSTALTLTPQIEDRSHPHNLLKYLLWSKRSMNDQNNNPEKTVFCQATLCSWSLFCVVLDIRESFE